MDRSRNKNGASKELIYFTSLTIILTTLWRLYALHFFGINNNDDIIYHGLAENIFAGKGIYFDLNNYAPELQELKNGTHVHFPPGYPVILGIQSFIIGNVKFIKAIEWIFLTGLNSLLTIIICWEAVKKYKYLSVIICSLPPVFIYGVATITISSENWCLFLSLIGIIYCLKYSKNKKFINLTFANTCFALAYLIRPEGLVFYASSIVVVLINQNRNYFKTSFLKNNNLKNILKTFLSFLIPIVSIILPYVAFLYRNLGFITLTGKVVNWDNIAISESISDIQRYKINLLSLIDSVTSSPYFSGISFTIFIIIIAINILINPQKITGIFNSKQNNIIIILAAPLPFCLFTYIKYAAYARSIYCFLPNILIISLWLFSYFNKLFDESDLVMSKFKLFGNKISLLYLLIFSSLFNLGIPIYSNNFLIDNPKLYYEAIDKIIPIKSAKNNFDKNIWSRDLTAEIYRKDINLCNDYKALRTDNYEIQGPSMKKPCKKALDYIILSNIDDVSMYSPSPWETNSLNSKKITIEQKIYTKVLVLRHKSNLRKVVVFKIEQ